MKVQNVVIWITDSLNIHVTTDDICNNITKDVETRFDTSNFELDRLLPKEKKLKSNRINEKWV